MVNLKNMTFKQKIIAATIFIIIFGGGIATILEQPLENGIIKSDIKICKNKYSCEEYKMADKVQVRDVGNNQYKIFKNSNIDVGLIDAKNIILEGTPEYDKFLKDYDEYQKTKKATSEAQNKKILKELEPNIQKAFTKIEFKQLSNDGNGTYNFYINPIIWNKLNAEAKQDLFKKTSLYVQLKTNGSKIQFAKLGTKIRNASNNEIFAEYTLTKGIILK